MHFHLRKQTSTIRYREILYLPGTGLINQEHQSKIAGNIHTVRTTTTSEFTNHLLNTTITSPIEGILGQENREQITFEQEQALASSKTLTAFRMPAGDHAFLFNIPLPSKIFETITGPNHQYHAYRVHAIVERRLKSDFVVSQPIRIYQVSDLETSYLRPHCPLVSPVLYVQAGKAV
jgi:hypothetical protein